MLITTAGIVASVLLPVTLGDTQDYYSAPDYDGYNSYNSVSSGYGTTGYEEPAKPSLPSWLMPALLAVCALGLIPGLRILPSVHRKRRSSTEDEVDEVESSVDIVAGLYKTFLNQNCMVKVGCEMMELSQSNKYPTLVKAFGPLTNSKYRKYYTPELCENLKCDMNSGP